MNFWFDKERSLLIYQPPSPLSASQVLQHVEGAKELNGAYIAVPATLRNSQVLRWLQYPVQPIITDDNYDWPRNKNLIPHPYESQKLGANFLVLNPRCFDLSDMGCVAGETLIDTDTGRHQIVQLARQAKRIKIRTIANQEVKYVEIDPPFLKGRTALYRVNFASGRSIVVTANHVFLTCRGWLSCASLLRGEFLPVFADDLQRSTLEPALSKSRPDVRHSIQTVLDCLYHSRNLFCDGRPLLEEDSVSTAIPLQDDAQEPFLPSSQTDDPDNKYRYSFQILLDHLSKIRCGARSDRAETGYFLSEYATKLLDNQFHIYAQYRRFPIPVGEVPEDQGLELCIPLDFRATSKISFDCVTSISYERTDVYYDMHVPKHENYLAHGLCNHNTGKTMRALWAAEFLMRQQPGTRALIVAPLSILERVWASAIFTHLRTRTAEILHGTAEKRMQLLESSQADFLIVNFDGVGIGARTRKKFELDGFSKALVDRSAVRIVIVDEASGYRDATTKRHRIARHVIGRRDYLWLLTGTPTPNAPTDAYGLAKLVNNAQGKSFRDFRQETMYQPFPNSFRWLPRQGGYDRARALLQPAIRFDIASVWDGPPVTVQQRQVELTSEQKIKLAELKRDLVITLKSGKQIDAINEAAKRTKFLQIVQGAIYDGDRFIHLIDAEPRLREIESVVESTSRKIVMFVSLTSVLNLHYKRLSKRWKVLILNGSVSPAQRSENIKRFEEDSDVKIMLADPQTTAHGINEFALVADTVLWASPTDKGELYIQGNKRVNRPGQKYPMTIVQIVSTKVEQEIFQRLETRMSMQGLLLDAVQRGEL